MIPWSWSWQGNSNIETCPPKNKSQRYTSDKRWTKRPLQPKMFQADTECTLRVPHLFCNDRLNKHGNDFHSHHWDLKNRVYMRSLTTTHFQAGMSSRKGMMCTSHPLARLCTCPPRTHHTRYRPSQCSLCCTRSSPPRRLSPGSLNEPDTKYTRRWLA